MSHIRITLKYFVSKAAVLAPAFAALAFICSQPGYARSEGDSLSLDEGFHQMYNLDFAAAHETFEAWQAVHPDDPLGAAANAAAYLFAEFDRMHVLELDRFTESRRIGDFDKLAPDAQSKAAFESELARADGIASKMLAKSSDDRNALFARVLTDGLRGNYAALVEKRTREAIDFLKSSRTTAEKLIAVDPSYYDAYLAVGIENYVLGVRSAPTRFMLRLTGAQTSKDKGIANLKTTAEQGRYLAPYARVLLVIAYLRDEDRKKAKNLLAGLVRDFPNNRRYQLELERLRG